MRAIASGVALSQKTEREPVVIWHKDKGLNAAFSDIFHTDNLPFVLKETNTLVYNLIYEQPRKLNLYISAISNLFDGKRRIVQDYNKDFISDEKEIEKIVASSDADVIIQSGFVFHHIDGKFMNSIFRYNARVRSRMEEILGGNSTLYALQIRRTDNNHSIANSPLEAFEDIARKLVAKDERVKIFLATDDDETKRHFRILYPQNIIVNPEIASRRSREGIIDAAAELYIMAQCREIYGSYWSSFSEIASLIGENILHVVKK